MITMIPFHIAPMLRYGISSLKKGGQWGFVFAPPIFHRPRRSPNPARQAANLNLNASSNPISPANPPALIAAVRFSIACAKITAGSASSFPT